MSTIIGVSGDVGSFSEQAAFQYAATRHETYSLVHLIDMDGVLAALESDDIDLGIFPVFNNVGGVVAQAFKAMGEHAFEYLESFNMNIEQCLITISQIALNKITSVISHSQGLVQCQAFIKKSLPNAKIIEEQDTALAARRLAEGKYEPTSAVIAPKGCAEHYHLYLDKVGIQDIEPNVTTFIVVRRRS